MPAIIRCSHCHSLYPENSTPHLCGCGGVYDYELFPEYVEKMVDQRKRGIWKYFPMFGLKNDAVDVSLGEGDTPLLSGLINGHLVYFKMECQNPTGSFKDRGTAVLSSFLLSRGIGEVVEDSSGNAGASLAAYAARTGLKVTIYAPESTSGPKRNQIEAYGADLVLVPGPRSEAARAVLEAVDRGSVYASHAYMPFGLTGYATIAYEIYESLKMVPGTIITPAGHGGLLYGIMLGFDAMLRAGIIAGLPRYIGVQAENCSPMTQAYRNGEVELVNLKILATLAEGASVANPVRSAAILHRMFSGQGEMHSASEKRIIEAYQLLARQGIYCEPTSSLSITPLLDDTIDIMEPVIAIITGSGYKTNKIL